MANYDGTSRTNYFRVKDPIKFKEWAVVLGLELQEDDKKAGMFVLFPDRDSADFPNVDSRDDSDLDFPAELSKFLAEGSVAVILSAGSERQRYVHGSAIAVNAAGESVEIGLNDIYALALAKLGGEVTRAEY